jgi:hypothetical protein
MNNPSTMTTTEIYRHLRTLKFDQRRANHLVAQFHRAALFLAERVKSDGWKWRNNYLREHVGCAFGTQFTNSVSPYIMELLFRQYPQFREYETPEAAAPLLAPLFDDAV